MMRRLLLAVGFGLLLLSVACAVAFEVKGSVVQPDGLLCEPFFLVPVAWFLGISGAGTLLLGFLRK